MTNMIRTILRIVSLLFFCIYTYGGIQDPISEIDKYLNAHVKNLDFSGSVLITREGKILFSKSYGLADYENNVPNRLNTKFRLGSLTKPFTALAVLILQEKKKLNIEDHIIKFIPEYPNGDEIKIHHLLTHSSGIPNYTAFNQYKMLMKHRKTPFELIEIFKDQELVFKPGTKFEYSNSGYVVLGIIIEKNSGKPYEDYLTESIFDPLEMRDTGFDHHFSIIKDRARGFIKAGDTFENAEYIHPSNAYSAGGLYSTVNDLLKFVKAIEENKLVSEETWNNIFESFCPTGYGSFYGYGWFIDEVYGKKRINHPGGIQGFSSHLSMMPEEKINIILLCNLEFAPLEVISRGITGILFDKQIRIPFTQETSTIKVEDLKEYTGLFKISEDLLIKVFVEGNRLFIEPSGQPVFQILHRGKENFGPRMGNWYLTFIKNGEGDVTGLILHVNGEDKPGKKIEQDK